MTSTLTRPLQLELADSTDLREICRHTYDTWSGGLSKSEYYDLNYRSLTHPWARKHYRYFALRKGNDIVASCKLYSLDFQARGQQFRVIGVGGVFTPEHRRGHGYASEMMRLVVKLAEQEKYDAALLFSDIDPSFYENVGFEELPNDDFHIWVNTPEVEQLVMSGPGFIADMHGHSIDIAPLTRESIPEIMRHYPRYLRRQTYGIVRSTDYLDFKLFRALYRVGKIEDWSIPEIMILEDERNQGGYAVFEQGERILRVLEVVGGEEARDVLWRNILRNARLRHCELVRGWEAAAPSFRKFLRYTERSDWAWPMMHVINPACQSWLELDICPLLESDHF